MSNTGATGFEGRTARMERTTSESSVLVEINLDGTGVSDISTSVPFYDHMLTALSKHSLIDMTVKATGDIHIDVHHTVEDVAITFGEVLRTALGNKAGIRRFGEATVPLDEALAHAVVDVSGRPYLVHGGEPAGQEYHPKHQRKRSSQGYGSAVHPNIARQSLSDLPNPIIPALCRPR